MNEISIIARPHSEKDINKILINEIKLLDYLTDNSNINYQKT